MPVNHGVLPDSKTAFIESAKVLGMGMLPKKERDPKCLSSYGLCELIKELGDSFEELIDIFIGVGGTSTNDMGIGALSALGLKLFDQNDDEIEPIPVNYSKISGIDCSELDIPFVNDVNNPLLGEKGATRVY